VIYLASQLNRHVLTKKKEIKEIIYTNIDFFIRYYRWTRKKDFFEFISENTDISIRTILSWYYKEKLPQLHTLDVTKLTRHFRIHFADFISIYLDENCILSYLPEKISPSDIAKQNILKLLIKNDIRNANQFEAFIEGHFSSSYYYVLHRKGEFQRNLSWESVIIFAYYFNISLNELFKMG